MSDDAETIQRDRERRATERAMRDVAERLQTLAREMGKPEDEIGFFILEVMQLPAVREWVALQSEWLMLIERMRDAR